MCYRPLHIKSHDGKALAYDVPCGHCEECLISRRQEMLVRCWYQFLGSRQKALFCTLTYNDKSLPFIVGTKVKKFPHKYNLRSKDRFHFGDVVALPRRSCHFDSYRDGFVVHEPTFSPSGELLDDCGKRVRLSCWNKSHIQKFLKRLNETALLRYAKSKGIIRKSRGKLTDDWKSFVAVTPRPFHYLVVCERGSSRMYMYKGKLRQATSRPHYHMLLFLNIPVMEVQFAKDLVNELWEYGINEDLSINRTAPKAIEYVTKYVTKDLSDPLFNDIVLDSHDDELQALPFVLQSQGIGLYYLHHFNSIISNGGSLATIAELISKGVPLPGTKTSRVANTPRYYLNKLCKVKVNHEPVDNRYISAFVDSSAGFPILLYDWVNDLYKPSEVIDTLFGSSYQRIVREKSADFYMSKYRSMLSDDNFSSWHLLTYDKLPDMDMLYYYRGVGSDDLYLYFLQERNIIIESTSGLNICKCGRILTDYLIYQRNQLRVKRESDYKSKLLKSMRESPELFSPHCWDI